MGNLFLIGMGGFFGAVSRYLVSGIVQYWTRSISFPYGTLAVNVIGCFLIGFAMHLADAYNVFSSDTRAFLFIGFLGAFTTFATFGNETINLLRNGENLLSLTNIAAQIIFGLGAVWLGRTLSAWLWS